MICKTGRVKNEKNYYNYRFLHYVCSVGAPYASVGMTVGGFVIVTEAHYVKAGAQCVMVEMTWRTGKRMNNVGLTKRKF